MRGYPSVGNEIGSKNSRLATHKNTYDSKNSKKVDGPKVVSATISSHWRESRNKGEKEEGNHELATERRSVS